MRLPTPLLLFTTLTLHAATTPLTKAIRLEEFGEAKKHLTPELVNKPDDGLYHPLTYAVYTGNNDLIEALLKAGANPNNVEHNGKTALYVAANLGNSEAIALLHHNNAKLPTDVKALPIGKAAVYSGSAETLTNLLDKYPQLDVNKGWPKPSSKTRNMRCGSLNYACFYAYNEMALVLLKHGASTKVREWKGDTALDYAAKDARCSLELVNALLAAGMDPITRSRGNHLTPNSPLEHAAANGSLDKVKAMLEGRRAGNLKAPILRAGFIASAHNHIKISTYLFQLIGTKHPDSKSWLAANKERIQSGLVKTHTHGDGTRPVHNPIRGIDLRQLMPATRRPSKVAKPGTLAIVAPGKLRNMASLISAELSSIKGLTLLERDDLARILRENKLNSVQADDRSAFRKALKVIPASHLVILTESKNKANAFTQISLVTTGSGIITTRLALPSKVGPETKLFSETLGSLANSVSRSLSFDQHATAISVTPVKPEHPNSTSLAAADLVNTTLPYHVTNSRGCVLLSRKQIQYLETEKAIGQEGSYWSAAWTIDGSVKLGDGKQVTVILRASDTRSDNNIVVEHTSPLSETQSAVRQAWEKLVKKITRSSQPSTGAADNSQKQPRERSRETELLLVHADWLIRSGYPQDALPLTRASIALGNETQKTYRLALLAKLQTLPVSRSVCCAHIRAHPQNLETVKKLVLSREIPGYIGLCSTAIKYTSLLKTAHPSRNSTYNPPINDAIAELCFFRVMMNDSMILKSHSRELARLDKKIEQLIRLYMRQCRGSGRELKTLQQIIENDHHFLETILPDLLADVIRRIEKLTHKGYSPEQPFIPNPVAELIPSRIKRALVKGQSLDVWIRAQQSLAPSTVPNDRGQLLASQFYQTASMAKKRTLVRKMIATVLSCEPGWTSSYYFHSLPYPRPPALLCSEADEWGSFLIQKNLPPGGIRGYFFEQDIASIPASEISRSPYFYQWLSSLKYWKADDWKRNIIRHTNKNNNESGPVHIAREDWSALRIIAKKHGKLSPALAALFDKVIRPAAPVRDKSRGLELKLLTTLPDVMRSPALGQLAIPTQARVLGNEVWIPSTYNPWKSLRPQLSNARYVIHVVNLDTLKTRTIPLPQGPRDFVYRQLNDRHRVIHPAKDYVYIQTNNGGNTAPSLFCIDRKTYQAHPVKLPLPYFAAIASNPHHNSLCVSATSERTWISNKKNTLNDVLLINGPKVVKTLVSNQRKPAQSNLDSPDVLIQKIHHTGRSIRLYSHPNKRYTAPHMVKGATYDLAKQTWSPIPGKMIASDVKRLKDHEGNAAITHKYIRRNGHTYYFPNDIRHSASLCLSTDKAHALRWGASMQNDPAISAYYHLLPARLEPLDGAQFDKVLHLVRLDNAEEDDQTQIIQDRSYRYKGWRLTHNDLIRRKNFNVQVIGKWNKHYIIALHRKDKGIPALWQVSEQNIIRHLERSLARKPCPVTFDLQKTGPFTELTYPHVLISAGKNHAQIWKNHGIENSQTLRINGGDKRSVILTSAGTFKDGFTSLSLHARRWQRENPFHFRISIMLDGAWKEIHNADKVRLRMPLTPNVKLDFPQKTEKIRLELTSHPKNAVLIDDLILR